LQHVKTHSFDTTNKFSNHLHANKLMRFIHQAAKHTVMVADAKTLYGATLDEIVENLALEDAPCVQSSPTPLLPRLPFAKSATSTTSIQSVYWRAAVTARVAAMRE